MQTIRIFLAFLAILSSGILRAQYDETIKAYIEKYKELAIAEMQRTGVPASIKLAQGIYETTAGTSKLVLKSNNHFGIKCKSNWTGESVSHDDDARGECFRKYPSSEDSYRDHSNFLRNNSRYAFLFNLDPTDYEGWANGLKKAGYATNPRYPQALIKMITDYQLQEFTMLAMGTRPAPVKEEIVTSATPQETIPMPAVKQVYPEGEFKINDTKAIFVKKGTAYLAIAQQFRVDLSKIYEFNELARTEFAEVDQLVYLQRKRKTGINEYHIVQPGETLQYIAQMEAMRLESLIEYNWLKENEVPAPGERLSLRKKSDTMPKLAVRSSYPLIRAPQPKTTSY